MLKDLFVINPTKYYKLKNEEILSSNGTVPLVSNSTTNNGAMGFSELEPLNKGNSITCSDTTVGADTMYYQDNDFIGYSHVQHFVPKFSPFNKTIALFIISSCRIATAEKYDYGNKFNRKAMNNTKIQLPIKSGKIDFDFVENIMSKLECSRLDALMKHFSVTGMDDCTLTSDETSILSSYSSLTWNKFNLETLFGKSTRGKRLKSADRVSGTLPFVTAGEANEGVSDFIGNNVTIFSENTTTIDMFGSAKYRNYKYGADDHVAVVHTEKLSKCASLFVTAAIHKASHTGEFHYGNNFYAKDADELNICLPVKDAKPDYATMETLISALQKLVIRDVVLYVKGKLAQKGVSK